MSLSARARDLLSRGIGGVSRRISGLEFDELMAIGAGVVRTLPGDTAGVALTFDDGPSDYGTAQVLDVLAAHQALATFFLLGANVRRHPSLAREIAARGHTVGAHGDQHLDYHWISHARMAEDLRVAGASLEDVLGQPVRLARAPFGHVRWDVPRVAKQLGIQRLVGWSVAPAWHEESPDRLADYVNSRVQTADIVLLHDANALLPDDPQGRIAAVVAGLPAILCALRDRGLEARRIEV